MTDLERTPDLGATRFVAPRSLGDVVSASVRFLIDNARALAVGQLTIAGPALVLFIAAQALTGTAEVFAPEDPFAVDGAELLTRFGSTLLLPYLALLVLTVLSYGVAYGFIRAYRDGRADGADLWEDVRPVLWPLVSVTLLAAAIWMVAGITLSIVIGVIGAVVSPVLAVAGAFALLGVLLYVLPAWTLSYAARLFDVDRAGEAISRGFSLVRGRWWMSFGVVLVIGLIGMVMSIVIVLPAALLQGGVEAAGGAQTAWSGAIFTVFNMLGTMAFATLIAVSSAFLHGSLSADADDVILSDGLDRLEDGLERLEDGAVAAPRTSSQAPPRARDDRFAPPTAAPSAAEAPAPTPTPAADPAPTPDAPPADAEPDADDTGGFRGGGFRGGGFGS